ncbi:SDR family NAD(P)-dependent oxidoreductase [Nocardia sp. NPDC057663]|uniref:SDR family NAD(P)-dependent oxidoreductase n=1 Tax=Nocardia sp. NPDC057663 TaxID=3346201 RepID=UPI00366D184B
MTFDGRIALVTGGSRGIGRATARLLAARGAAVAVNYRADEEAAKSVVAEIAEAGGTAIAIGADVSDPSQAHSLVARTVAELGGLHILVNNAGIARDGLIYDMEPADWLAVMQVNFGGVFNSTKAVLDQFMSQRDGVIVNVSSVMAERGWIGQSNYSASKGAINAFTYCSAVELARFGIRVNAVLPGFSPTDLIGGLLEVGGGKKLERQIPLRALAEVEQIAEAIAFLAGPGSAYMTGEVMRVDGGFGAQLGTGRMS